MAEEIKGEKWEGPGKPEGDGGVNTPAPHGQDVEGRERKEKLAICWKCGATGAFGAWTWFTCWNCGELNYIGR